MCYETSHQFYSKTTKNFTCSWLINIPGMMDCPLLAWICPVHCWLKSVCCITHVITWYNIMCKVQESDFLQINKFCFTFKGHSFFTQVTYYKLLSRSYSLLIEDRLHKITSLTNLYVFGNYLGTSSSHHVRLHPTNLMIRGNYGICRRLYWNQLQWFHHVYDI